MKLRELEPDAVVLFGDVMLADFCKHFLKTAFFFLVHLLRHVSLPQVIYRALSPPYSADDPYSPEAQEQLKITNLRVQLLKCQSCPCLSNDLNAKPPQLTYYALYDFIVKGSCFCNGHADHCVPIKGFRPVKAAGIFHVVS